MNALRTYLQHGLRTGLGFALATVTGLRFAPQGGGTQDPEPPQLPSLPNFAAFGTADSNGRMIAVTGIDMTGTAILYVIDTENPHIAVYQAQGGSASSHNIKLIAARNITLDLQLDGLNDKSQYSFKQLQDRFRQTDPQQQPPR